MPGEKASYCLDALEPFHPERVASRILGVGDVLSLVKEAERKVDREKAQKMAAKLATGKAFDLEDFRDQLTQMEQMGGMSNHGKTSRHGASTAKIPRPVRRRANRAQHRHHQFHVPPRKTLPGGAARRTQKTHRPRRRRSGAGSQPPPQTIHANTKNDEAHEKERRHETDDGADATRRLAGKGF